MIEFNKQDTPLTIVIGSSKEMMRFEADGRIFVRGEQVDDNKEVYKAFREWLESVNKRNISDDLT